jgi:ribosomal protein S18 acetylase RimI-like enzyme
MIRLANKADHDVLLPLVVGFRDHFQLRSPLESDIASSLRLLLNDPDTDFIVALSGEGASLGYVQVRYRYSLWLVGFEAQLEDLFVLPSSRRGGLGLRLVEAAVVQAQKRGCRFIGLNTNERNVEAFRLYTRAGFSAARQRWQGGRQVWLERADIGAA